MEAVTTTFRNRVKQDGRKMGRASYWYREGRAERRVRGRVWAWLQTLGKLFNFGFFICED